jgi:hypothetical protein
MYWLVGSIDGLPDERHPLHINSPIHDRTNTPSIPVSSLRIAVPPDSTLPPTISSLPPSSHPVATAPTPTSPSDTSSTPASAHHIATVSDLTLPSYADSGREPADVIWLRGSVRSERRIAISHNPNPEGGVSRFDNDFTHNLFEFGTCRIQVRVNEVSLPSSSISLTVTVVCGCLFPIRLTCLALSPLATLFAIRAKLIATTTITPPSTGKSTVTKESFDILEHGLIPQPLSAHPQTDSPALWRGIQAGGSDCGDFAADLSGKLPVCENLHPTTLPGMHMPK